MTDTERNFMRAIIERPDCDLTRLEYADWLEENAGTAACKGCRGKRGFSAYNKVGVPVDWYVCPTCHGTGTVSNGNAERAEFVRIQIELAGLDSRTDSVKRWNALRERERELIAAYSKEWFGDWAVFGHSAVNLYGNQSMFKVPTAKVERGFVSTVAGKLVWLVGGECESCDNGGNDTGAVTPWGQPISIRCQDCHGTGRTPGIAREIAKEQPVTRWRATDKEPEQPRWANWRWYEGDDDGDDAKWHIGEMYGHLPGYVPPGQVQPTWATRELALAALSDAIAKHAKGECK